MRRKGSERVKKKDLDGVIQPYRVPGRGTRVIRRVVEKESPELMRDDSGRTLSLGFMVQVRAGRFFDRE